MNSVTTHNQTVDGGMTLVGCGILQKEIRHLITKNRWPLDMRLCDSSLHVNFDKLQAKLEKSLQAPGHRPTFVFYGACHPLMDKILTRENTIRTKGQNCVEILIGKTVFTRELENGAFFLMEDWARRFEYVTGIAFNENPEVTRQIFQMEHKYLLGLRTPCSADFSGQAEKVSRLIDLPLRWMDVGLDHLEQVMEQAMKKKKRSVTEANSKENSSVKGRLKRLAADKSQLQLYADLINKLSMVKGLDNVAYQIVTLLMKTLGGFNITLYYSVRSVWHSMDAFRAKSEQDCFPDSTIQQAMDEKEIVFLDAHSDTLVLPDSKAGGFKTGATWIIPMVVENESIGAIKMEGMLLVRPDMMEHLKPFVNYAALVLRSEIENYAELEKAYKDIKKINRELSVEIAERQKSEEALQISEKKYRSLFENASDAVLVFDAETLQIEDTNHTTLELFGYTRQEFLNLKILAISAEPDKTASTMSRFRSDAKQQLIIPKRIFKKKNCEEFPGEVYISSYTSGARKKVIGSIRDLSGRQQLESQLRQAQKMEAIGTLAGGIAHDFNNILMPIIGYTELVQSYLPEHADANRHLDHVIKAAHRAKGLVKHILTYSRQTEQEKKPLLLQSIVKESLKFIRSTIPTTIEIRENIESTCEEVMADPTQIHQVVMNLCTNAHHAMRENGGVLAVALSQIDIGADSHFVELQIEPGTYLRLEICDTGCGMPPWIIERVFDPYFSTKKTGEGTGMGLAIVHGIVNGHQGKISVYSEVGKGTTFVVYLPCIDSESHICPVDKSADMDLKGRERILLVDDEQAVVEVEKLMLESLGYQVKTMSKSVEALALIQGRPDRFDLIITDMTMPNMTGTELAESIHAFLPQMPIILCTGFSELIDGEKAHAMGVRKFLMKPLTKEALATAVRETLENR